MDWDRLMSNAARGSDFTGCSAADEQAYFEAFSCETPEVNGRRPIRVVRDLLSWVIGFFGARFMVR